MPISEKHRISTTYAVSVDDYMQSKVMRSSDKNMFRSKNDESEGNTFVGIIQSYIEKTFTRLKANSIVAYPVYVVSLNFPEQY